MFDGCYKVGGVIYLMNCMKRELHFLITRAVLDSSSWLLLKSKPSSILPSSCSTACFSSTLPTPFFLVSYDYNKEFKAGEGDSEFRVLPYTKAIVKFRNVERSQLNHRI